MCTIRGLIDASNFRYCRDICWLLELKQWIGGMTGHAELQKSILVVDDEFAFCEVVCEILEAAGYRARQANHVNEAYLQLEEELPDLILTDVMMPDIDGLTFIRDLRSQPRYSTIPMIVVSAKSSSNDQKEAIDAGATQVISKPFSSDLLESVVHSFLKSN